MYAVPGASRPDDRRFALKHATDAAHSRVEGIIESAGMFQTLDGYRRYLAGSYAARARMEHWLDEAGAETLWPDWPRRRIAHLIAADIDDLGGIPLAVRESSPHPLNPAELLGVLYVLEGSSLGARVLVNMTDGLGLSASYGARHLHAQAGDRAAWRSFLSLMSASAEPPCAKAALSAFEAFAEAYSREATV